MAFPREDDLAPRRGREAARRADYFAGAVQFLAFLKTHELGPLDNFTNYGSCASLSYEIPAGSFRERRARADEIASSISATPTWRNGCYMAVRQDGLLRTQIHFFPPILAADAEDAA
jgi:hypothetical protein